MVIRSASGQISKRRGKGLGSHRFRQGDIIMLSRNNPLTEKPIEAVVSNRSRDSIRVVLPEAPKGLRKGMWRIDRELIELHSTE